MSRVTTLSSMDVTYKDGGIQFARLHPNETSLNLEKQNENSSLRISNVLTENDEHCVASKIYVDRKLFGISSSARPIDLATTTNISGTYSEANGGFAEATIAVGLASFSIDSTNVRAGMRLLVKNQTNRHQNGVYLATKPSSTFVLRRAIDFSNPEVVALGYFVFVRGGGSYLNRGFALDLALAAQGTGASQEFAFVRINGLGTVDCGDGLIENTVDRLDVDVDEVSTTVSLNTVALRAAGIFAANFSSGCVINSVIAPDAVASHAFASDSVRSEHLPAVVLSEPHLAPSSVNTSALQDGSVLLAKMAPNSVNTSKVEDGSVTSAKIADETIASSNFAENTLANDRLQNSEISGHALGSEQISTLEISAGSRMTVSVDGDGYDGSSDKQYTIDTVHDHRPTSIKSFAGLTLDGATGLVLKDGPDPGKLEFEEKAENFNPNPKKTIVAAPAMLSANYTVTLPSESGTLVTKNAVNEMSTEFLFFSTTHPMHLQGGTNAQTDEVSFRSGTSDTSVSLAVAYTSQLDLTSSSSSLQVADGAIGTADLGDGAVESRHVPNGHILESKLADAAVTESKLQDEAVTTAKLDVIDADKFAAGAVETAKMVDLSIDSSTLFASATIQNDRLQNSTVSGRPLGSNLMEHALLDAADGLIIANGVADHSENKTTIIRLQQGLETSSMPTFNSCALTSSLSLYGQSESCVLASHTISAVPSISGVHLGTRSGVAEMALVGANGRIEFRADATAPSAAIECATDTLLVKTNSTLALSIDANRLVRAHERVAALDLVRLGSFGTTQFAALSSDARRVPGTVVFEQQSGLLQLWNGSAWIAIPSGAKEHTILGANGIVVSNGVFDNDADVTTTVALQQDLRNTAEPSFVGYSITSDRSLKKNVTTVRSALKKIRALSAVRFEWKHNRAKKIGVTAQQVRRSCPEAVSSVHGKLRVNNQALLGLLIGAVNELHRTVRGQRPTSTRR